MNVSSHQGTYRRTKEAYWHWCASHPEQVPKYGQKAQTMLLQIPSVNNQVGDDQKTPLHVAIEHDNIPAALFLLSSKADVNIRDASQKTPLEVAKKKDFAIYHLFQPYHLLKCPEKFTKILPQPIPIQKGPYTYVQNRDDFGVINSRVLLKKPSKPLHLSLKELRDFEENRRPGVEYHLDFCDTTFIDSLREVMGHEGIDYRHATAQYFPRDAFTLPNSTNSSEVFSGYEAFIGPPKSDAILKAQQQIKSLLVYQHERAAHYLSSHSLFGQQLFGSAIYQDANARTCATENEMRNGQLRFSLEFGDKFFSSNQKGEGKFLIGEQHIAYIHCQLRNTDVFRDPNITVTPVKGATKDEMRKAAEEMYALGMLNGGKGLLSDEKMAQIASEAKKQGRFDIKEFAIEKGYIQPLDLEDAALEQMRKPIEQYLGEKRATREIIAHSFGVDEKHLVALPDCAYHLDVFLAPGPNGSFFIYDPQTTLETLKRLKKNGADFALTDQDKQLLEQYIQTAEQLQKELGKLYKETKKILKKAGFSVIPTPGIFFDQSKTKQYPKTQNIHFMNPLTGFSEKTNSYYWITMGSFPKDRLGITLMDLFTAFLQGYIPNIHVYFTGRDPKTIDNYAQAEQFFNMKLGSFEPQAGAHCMSVPLRTKEHRVLPLQEQEEKF